MSFQIVWRRMKKSKFFLIGSISTLLIVLIVLIGPEIVPYDYETPDFANKNLAPQWFSDGLSGHILGCDPLGRDLFARVLYGGRISFLISIVVVVFSLVLGTILGLTAGFFGGAVDMVITRICEIFMAVPPLMLALCVVAIMGVNFTNLIIVMLITSWTGYTRLVRGNVLSIRNSEYVKASTLLGASRARIMFTQILPNVVTPLIIQASQQLGGVILIESSLSYLGCGVPLPTPAWGSMIADGRKYLTNAPWIVIVPGVALMVSVLAFNFLGDGLRDCLDPKSKD